MIVFDGENSLECKQSALEKRRKRLFKCQFFAIPVYLISIIIILIFKSSFFAYVFLVAAIGIFMFVMSYFLIKSNFKSLAKNPWRYKIEFDGGKIIFTDYANCLNTVKESFDTEKVKTVTDRGLYYDFFVSGRQVFCEKALITEGSVDEFEKMFEGKIIKKLEV